MRRSWNFRRRDRRRVNNGRVNRIEFWSRGRRRNGRRVNNGRVNRIEFGCRCNGGVNRCNGSVFNRGRNGARAEAVIS